MKRKPAVRCPSCGKENRDEARFCRFCGTGFSIPVPADGMERLAGMPEIRKALEELDASLDAMNVGGSSLRLNHNTIIMGNSGTGKSLVSRAFCELLARHRSITAYPVLMNAPDIENLDGKELESIFKSSAGGAIIIDNAQLLVHDGEPGNGLNRMTGLMDRFPLDPVIILTGLPYGLRELLKKEDYRHISSRFKNIFHIRDYTAGTLREIASADLAKLGMSLTDEAGTRLLDRFEYLARESRKADSAVESRNGYLAKNTVQDIVRSYYLRKGSDGLILPSDIQGDTEVKKTLDEAMKDLDAFVGLTELKSAVRALSAQIQARKERERAGESIPSVPFHIVLKGNPGTGKTSVTRVLGNILRAVGLLEMGHVVETDRGRLVGQYVGHTAPLVNRYCDMAMGGILFIDEAYALSRDDDGKDFGQEAVVTLLKRMEDDRGKFVVAVAGYPREMDAFLSTNSGLDSRFTHRFDLPDYTPSELVLIFRSIAKKNRYRLIEDKAEERLLSVFTGLVLRKTKNFANGRAARDVFEETERRHADRLSRASEKGPVDSDEYAVIRAGDIPLRTGEGADSLKTAFAALDELAGLFRVKARIREIADTIEVSRLRGQEKPLPLHFVFEGNAGTGKTTVARLLADILFHLGVVTERKLVEADRGTLVARYAGQTAPLVETTCDRAMGGVLFIDEAYSLVQNDGDQFGREAVETLLKRMENDRGKFVVILAGYPREMDALLHSNPGLRSRFTDIIRFDDFTAEEMVGIFRRFAKEEGYKITRGLLLALGKILEDLYAKRGRDFSNGRTVRDLFEKIRARQSTRIRKMQDERGSEQAVREEADILRLDDIPGIEKYLPHKERKA